MLETIAHPRGTAVHIRYGVSACANNGVDSTCARVCAVHSKFSYNFKIFTRKVLLVCASRKTQLYNTLLRAFDEFLSISGCTGTQEKGDAAFPYLHI